MALKNLFDMVKADRYTADGREAIIKAQEAETEDKVYQIGEISQKTGLQKTANGWVKPKKGTAPAKKQEKKGAGIPQATTETFVGKTYKDFVESATPSGYKPTKNTDNPDGSSTTVFEKEGKQLKVDFDKSGKITKVTPGENKPAAAPKLNQVEKVDGANRPYRIKGTQFYFETPEEAETAIVAGTRGEGKTYAKPSSDATINEIQNALGFKLDSEYAGKYSMDDFMKKTGKDEYGVKVWSFGTDSKGTLIDTIVEGYNKPNATIKKENGEWRLHYTDRDGKKMIVTPKGREWPTSDSAPRQLTGDCRIRIRKEKPALTGDTKIRVRK